MSWSNVCDYFTAEDFHTMARMCSSPEDTIHHAYTMNWYEYTRSTVALLMRPRCPAAVLVSDKILRLCMSQATRCRRSFHHRLPVCRHPQRHTTGCTERHKTRVLPQGRLQAPAAPASDQSLEYGRLWAVRKDALEVDRRIFCKGRGSAGGADFPAGILDGRPQPGKLHGEHDIHL